MFRILYKLLGIVCMAVRNYALQLNNIIGNISTAIYMTIMLYVCPSITAVAYIAETRWPGNCAVATYLPVASILVSIINIAWLLCMNTIHSSSKIKLIKPYILAVLFVSWCAIMLGSGWLAIAHLLILAAYIPDRRKEYI